MANLKEVKKSLSGYRYSDPAAREIVALKEAYKDLKLGTDQFVFPAGQRDTLARLKGTVPVSYRGSTYNIPIVIWLQKTFPQTNPIVFVTPTHDMSINTSKYVDVHGRVYMPYISEWRQGKSDLPTLVQILCTVFAENIPVYSRPKQPTGAPPSNYTSPSQYGGYPASSRPPYPSAHQPQYPPQQPGYPPRSGAGYSPYPVGQQSMPTPYGSGGYSQAPGYPPQPHPQPPQPSYPPAPAGGGYPGYPMQSMAPAGVVAAGLVGATSHISAEEERRRMEEEERQRQEVKRQSLESAVHAKIKRQLQSVLERAEDEMKILKQTQDRLQENNQKLNNMLTEMDQQQRGADDSIQVLTLKIAEMESIIEYLGSQPDKINVDEAVAATNPVYNQILRLYAEENAIDDTIYYLGEALRKGVITHEVFLKNVRDLSRKQFMARATIMKARDAAKLPQYGVTS